MQVHAVCNYTWTLLRVKPARVRATASASGTASIAPVVMPQSLPCSSNVRKGIAGSELVPAEKQQIASECLRFKLTLRVIFM